MRKQLIMIALCLAAAVCARASAATLVKGGKPTAVIVTSDKPKKSVLYAVEELQWHVQKSTGLMLKALKESAVKDTAQTLVLVGPSRLTKQMGIDPEKLPSEGYVIRATKKRLALVGRDEDYGRSRYAGDPVRNVFVKPGTLWAVYVFLDKVMGVKWLWPGELGTVVPKRNEIRVEDYYLASAPYLVQRSIRSSILNRHVKPYFDKDGADRKDVEKLQRDFMVWNRRHMMGRGARIGAGHAYTRWYKKYYRDHPDWFAMMPDGGRYSLGPKSRAKLCVSNPQVIEKMFEQGMDYLERAPNAISFSACPNDSAGYCTCPKCKAMDDPNGQTRTYYYKLRDGRELAVPWVSLSDRYAKMWNQLAARLAKTHPDKYVCGYAYADYRRPPVSTRLLPNVMAGYVGFSPLSKSYTESSRRDWQGWADAGARLYLRPNFLGGGHGFPYIYARRMAADIKFCAERGMIGTDFDTWQNHYAAQGLNVYVLVRLLGDQSRTAEGLIDEYCEAGFGKAARAVKAYFDRCEQVSELVYQDKGPKSASRSEKYANYGKLFDRDFVQDCRVLLYRARMMAPDPTVQKRIDFLQIGLDYADLAGRVLAKNYEMTVFGKDPQGTLELIGKKEAFLRKHLVSKAISPATLRYREYNKKLINYFGLDTYAALKDKNVFAILTDWKFRLDPKKVGDKDGWMKPGLNDLAWAPIKAGKWWEPQGYGGGPNRDQIKTGYNGVAWYRKKVVVPAELKGKKIILRFGGIDESGWVYVNGKKLAETIFDLEKNPDSWITPVECDITGVITFGKAATIAVKVEDNNGAGGLWRLVSLYTD